MHFFKSILHTHITLYSHFDHTLTLTHSHANTHTKSVTYYPPLAFPSLFFRCSQHKSFASLFFTLSLLLSFLSFFFMCGSSRRLLENKESRIEILLCIFVSFPKTFIMSSFNHEHIKTTVFYGCFSLNVGFAISLWLSWLCCHHSNGYQ